MGNLLFDGEGKPVMIDFESCGLADRAYDLAVFLRGLWKTTSDIALRRSRWQAFLGGYSELRQPSDRSLSAVGPYLVLRALWTMAVPTRLQHAFGTEWLRDPGYLTTHVEMIERFAQPGEPWFAERVRS